MSASPMKVLQTPTFYTGATHGFVDDLDWIISPHRWTTLASATNATAVQSTTIPGGVVDLHTGTVANNEVALYSTNKPVLFASQKPALIKGIVKFAEANTNNAGIVFGFSSAPGASSLAAGGASVATSFTGIIIYKLVGSLNWQVMSSLSTTQTSNVSSTVAGNSALQSLEIEFLPWSSTNAWVIPRVNGAQLLDNTTGLPIKQNYVFTSAAACAINFYAQGGSSTAEDLNVDLAEYWQAR